MREHMGVYRGKRCDNGEWVEGYFSRDTIIGGDSGARFGCVIKTIPDELWQCDWDEVDPDTVGECTGLRDKSGKLIFEGDVVRHNNDNPFSEIEEIGAVFFDEKFLGWWRTSNGAFHRGAVDTYRMSRSCVYEIIGNIHDNPELLKGERND